MDHAIFWQTTLVGQSTNYDQKYQLHVLHNPPAVNTWFGHIHYTRKFINHIQKITQWHEDILIIFSSDANDILWTSATRKWKLMSSSSHAIFVLLLITAQHLLTTFQHMKVRSDIIIEWLRATIAYKWLFRVELCKPTCAMWKDVPVLFFPTRREKRLATQA